MDYKQFFPSEINVFLGEGVECFNCITVEEKAWSQKKPSLESFSAAVKPTFLATHLTKKN